MKLLKRKMWKIGAVLTKLTKVSSIKYNGRRSYRTPESGQVLKDKLEELTQNYCKWPHMKNKPVEFTQYSWKWTNIK